MDLDLKIKTVDKNDRCSIWTIFKNIQRVQFVDGKYLLFIMGVIDSVFKRHPAFNTQKTKGPTALQTATTGFTGVPKAN